MKKKLLLLLLSALIIPTFAQADHFYCEADLMVIEDSESSETKQILFNVDLNPDANLMTGVLVTTSCFNQITEKFKNENTDFSFNNTGSLASGVLVADNLKIGKNSYDLNLGFEYDPEGGNDINTSYFILRGTLKSLNDDFFIHQNVQGKCVLKTD